VNKTTIYLPDDLREAVKRVAQTRGVPEAEVIRDAIRQVVARERPKPKFGLFSSGGGDGGESIARNVDKYLKGFGES
jgi:hypothetical protein